MARDDPHFRLRIPQQLKDRIGHDAKSNGRSINAEIVYRLQATLGGPVEMLWHDKYPLIDLRPEDVKQLDVEIGWLLREYYNDLRDKGRINENPAQSAVREDMEYLNDLLSISRGTLSPSIDLAAELGRLGARRYRRFPVGGPYVDNPFAEGDARRDAFVEGWRREGGQELFDRATKAPAPREPHRG